MSAIAAAHTGRRRQPPPSARPTADRVREALFSILGGRVADARVLDLFAGSGALGIEALSRGAASAVFVDDDGRAVRAVRANLAGLEAVVAQRNAAVFLRTTADQYDLVFFDPPYRHGPQLARELSGPVAAVLAPGGLVVTESDRRAPLDLSGFAIEDERRYGDTLIRLHAQH
jgi:16S rRNA (guanine966-N2)-methyltransferase